MLLMRKASHIWKKYEISHKLKEEFYKANKINYFSTNLSDYMKGEVENKIFKELLKRGLKRNEIKR